MILANVHRRLIGGGATAAADTVPEGADVFPMC